MKGSKTRKHGISLAGLVLWAILATTLGAALLVNPGCNWLWPNREPFDPVEMYLDKAERDRAVQVARQRALAEGIDVRERTFTITATRRDDSWRVEFNRTKPRPAGSGPDQFVVDVYEDGRAILLNRR